MRLKDLQGQAEDDQDDDDDVVVVVVVVVAIVAVLVVVDDVVVEVVAVAVDAVAAVDDFVISIAVFDDDFVFWCGDYHPVVFRFGVAATYCHSIKKCPHPSPRGQRVQSFVAGNEQMKKRV